jgi:hypothetical protein
MMGAEIGAGLPSISRELYDLVGLGEEPRHRPERLTTEVHVEARRDDLVARIGEIPTSFDYSVVEELRLLYGHDVRGLIDPCEQLFARRDGYGPVRDAVVGAYLGPSRAGVDGLLEDLNAAAGVKGAADAADQLLRLAREHRARDGDERPGPPGHMF